MAKIEIDEILDAIEETLSTADGVSFSQSYDELGEAIVDMPLLQVWPASGVDDEPHRSDRSTFGKGVSQRQYTIYADFFAQQRAHIGEDMAALVRGIKGIEAVLDNQTTKPYFGIEIQGFSWGWAYTTFVYGEINQRYVGARFTIDVWTY